MSTPTKELNTVFQNATEVTSLGADDRLMVIGADGEPKKIEVSFIDDKLEGSLRLSQNQWLRIATYNKNQGPAGILLLSHEWSSGPPNPTIIAFKSASNGGIYPINVNVLFSDENPSFKAIRCVADGDDRYIEVQFNRSNTLRPYIRLVAIEVESVPFSISTASDSDVINTVSIVGGVNHLRSISYTILQKGGLRNGFGNEGFIKHCRQRFYSRLLRHEQWSSRKDVFRRPVFFKERRYSRRYNEAWDIQSRKRTQSPRWLKYAIFNNTVFEGGVGFVSVGTYPPKYICNRIQEQRKSFRRLENADVIARKGVAA